MPPEPSPRRRASAARFCRAVSGGNKGPVRPRPGNPRVLEERASGAPGSRRSPARRGRLGQTEKQGQQRRLPGPLGPTRPCTCPGATSRSTPSSATTSPKDLNDPARTDGDLLGSIIDPVPAASRSSRESNGRRSSGEPVVSDLLSALVRRLVSSNSELGMYPPGTRDGA